MEVQTLLAVPVSVRLRLRWGAPLFVLLSLLTFASCGSGGGNAPTSPSSTGSNHPQQIPKPQKSKKTDPATNDGERASGHHAEKAADHRRHHRQGTNETTISKPNHVKRVPRNEPDSTAKAGACPTTLNAQQCSELTEEAAQDGHSPRQPSKPSCPQTVDRSTCEKAVQKAGAQAESAPSSQTEVPPQCPESLSRNQCEELEAQLTQHSP